MILEKIQKFRMSPNRTVLTFSKSETFNFSKKSELFSKQKGAKICFCNDNEENNAINTVAESTEDGENSVIGAKDENSGAENEKVAKNGFKTPKNASESNTEKECDDNCAKGNAISGKVAVSCTCNILLCDLIAGAGVLCLAWKAIKSMREMF